MVKNAVSAARGFGHIEKKRQWFHQFLDFYDLESKMLGREVQSVQSQLQLPVKSGRCREMVNCLRENFIYSEKRARDFVFSSLEATLFDAGAHAVAPTLARLSREVAADARDRAARVGYEFSSWSTTTKAVFNSMLAAGVLLSVAGTPVPLDIQAQATLIVGLKSGYRDITEAYLIECLIRKLGNVSSRDHKALAHALFRQFDPNVPVEALEDRVVMLLATLADRVILRPDGLYASRVDPM